MRVLTLIDVHWWNACAYYAVELSRGLSRRGIHVVVAGSPGTPAIDRARSVGLEVWTDFRFMSRVAMVRDIGRFTAAMRSAHFDVVDAHRGECHTWAALARTIGGPPVVRTRGDVRVPRTHLASRAIHQHGSAAHIVPSRFMHDSLIDRLGVAAARVHIIPAGIDTQSVRRTPETDGDARALRASYGIPDDAYTLAIVARLSPIKGHAIVLDAIAGLPAALRSRVHLLIAGQEEEVSMDELASRAATLGIGSQVHLHGRAADVRPVLRAADLQLIASLGSEAICRVLLEGMALGVPAIATTVGVIPEVIEGGVTGWLTAPGDVIGLSAALEQALSGGPGTRDRLAEMGREARQRTEECYDLDTWCDRTLAVYGRVAGIPVPSRGDAPRMHS